MKMRWFVAGFAVLGWLAPLQAQEPKKAAQVFQVPYQLTNSLHIMVRAKINGKGPFNFIIDTGAPILFVSTPTGKKLGLASQKGLTTLERFEMEGGVVQTKVKCRVETPFQLEGMNGLGMAGVELHGIIGYAVLAFYRMEIDFTKDAMTWTKLDFAPPKPEALKVKGGGGSGGLEIIGGLMKFLGFLAGKKANAEVAPRGYLGIELADANGAVLVTRVLAKSPAAAAGLKAGDRIEQVQSKNVRSSADVHQHAGQITVGQAVRISIIRAGEKREIMVTAGDGL
jgi:hypothetical protein